MAEEVTKSEEGQDDTLNNGEELVEDVPNDVVEQKRGRGRPPKSGSKRPPVKTEDGGPTPAKRGRGRPKSISKPEVKEEDAGSEGEDNDAPTPKRGRGRPKKVAGNSEEESNEDPGPPMRGRGRPKGSTKTAKPRGRPKGSTKVVNGSGVPKRGRGRPSGSSAKKTPVKVRGKVPGKRGRPRSTSYVERRGRPRKNPLLPGKKEEKGPRVWKPLGRPRKYPRVEPSPTTPATSPRQRGRPRKTESKKGAHLRGTPSTAAAPSDGTPRKRGRPAGSFTVKKNIAPKTSPTNDVPRKRGRPLKARRGRKKAANVDEEQVEQVEEDEEPENVPQEEEAPVEEEDEEPENIPEVVDATEVGDE